MTDPVTDPEDQAVAAAADALYALDPGEFTSQRDALAKQATRTGAPAAAKRIKALRKPTVAAALVNHLILHDPGTVENIVELGTRLRAAQDALDAPQLRDLSRERRALVAGLLAAALTRSAPEGSATREPSSAVRDEVTSTFDAAIADPDVAARLGRLTRSESWSGFGFGAGASPELTLVRGGRDTTRGSAKATQAKTAQGTTAPANGAPAKGEAAANRRLARALDKARDAFASAESALAAAESSEQNEQERVRTLGTDLTDLQRELDAAKKSLVHRRREAKSARARRREARSALDRAERHSDG